MKFDVDFDTSLSNPNLSSKLSAMADGKTAFIRVDSASSYICPKSVFDAIKGKNKTIVLSMDNVQWIFNGIDIVNDTKDININTAFSRVPGSTYSITNEPLKISFFANGILPGKATIRIKSDYTSNLFNINGNLYLYYLNGENLELEKSTQDIEIFLDGQDRWCEFDVTHNSDFLLSGEKLVQPEGEIEPEAQIVKGTTFVYQSILYKKLTKVTLGKNISKIESKAFYGNKKLKQIYIKSTGLKSVGSKAFGNIAKKAVIKVPSKKVSQYSKLFQKSGINKSVKVKKIS